MAEELLREMTEEVIGEMIEGVTEQMIEEVAEEMVKEEAKEMIEEAIEEMVIKEKMKEAQHLKLIRVGEIEITTKAGIMVEKVWEESSLLPEIRAQSPNKDG